MILDTKTMMGSSINVSGAGLGLRRSLLHSLRNVTTADIQFMEVAPENWINVGGRLGKQFRAYTERFPFVCHGLSLSIGSPAPLDIELLHAVKNFLNEHNIGYYSEHLSYCSDESQLYDLLPIPFTQEAVVYVADRIRQAQDILGQRIAIENASYYFTPQSEMTESEFINAVLIEADCEMLLDVNNLFVNSINHRYNATDFLRSLPGEKISYMHIAGHYHEAEDLRVDTHGAAVIPSVWQLLEDAYALFGVKPCLLERDFNIPSVPALLSEVKHIQSLQQQWRGGSTEAKVTADNQ